MANWLTIRCSHAWQTLGGDKPLDKIGHKLRHLIHCVASAKSEQQVTTFLAHAVGVDVDTIKQGSGGKPQKGARMTAWHRSLVKVQAQSQNLEMCPNSDLAQCCLQVTM